FFFFFFFFFAQNGCSFCVSSRDIPPRSTTRVDYICVVSISLDSGENTFHLLDSRYLYPWCGFSPFFDHVSFSWPQPSRRSVHRMAGVQAGVEHGVTCPNSCASGFCRPLRFSLSLY
ncbi:hypothetical protein JOL62DRAFT_568077, partial [Phyllosticta paracitricarpa]